MTRRHRPRWMMAALLLPGLAGCATVEDAPRGEDAYALVPPPPAIGMDYRISPDDVLRIQVYHEPGLSLEDAQVDAAGMVRMPLIVAILAGLVAGLAQVDMPGPVDTFIDFNGAAAPPIALFALGVVLSKTRMSADPVVLTVGAIKMLAFPALIWVVFAAVSPGWTPQSQQFILAAAGPAGAMAFSMALLYDVRADRIAQIIVGTSALTLLSLALVLTI